MNPHEAAERMITLSEEQSRLSEEATELEIKGELFVHAYRDTYKTTTATKTAWKVSEEGQRQTRVENRIRDIRSELSVIKNFLRHKENEGKNIY